MIEVGSGKGSITLSQGAFRENGDALPVGCHVNLFSVEALCFLLCLT